MCITNSEDERAKEVGDRSTLTSGVCEVFQSELDTIASSDLLADDIDADSRSTLACAWRKKEG